MKEIKQKQLNEIVGGVNITGAMINSLVRGINSLLDLGRSLGSAIRRAQSKQLCPL